MMNKKNFLAGFAAVALAGLFVFGFGGAQAVKAAAPETVAAQSVEGCITVKEAKQEALNDAGVKESDAVFKQAKLDTDDDTGIVKYEVDFFANDKDYEYDIDAVTAKIIKTDVDRMDAEDYQEMKALQAAEAEKKAAAEKKSGSEEITEQKALEIALNQAGLTANDVSYADTHLDFDDDTGITKYDVEFRAGMKEYSYEINSKTGEIVDFEVEIDD